MVTKNLFIKLCFPPDSLVSLKIVWNREWVWCPALENVGNSRALFLENFDICHLEKEFFDPKLCPTLMSLKVDCILCEINFKHASVLPWLHRFYCDSHEVSNLLEVITSSLDVGQSLWREILPCSGKLCIFQTIMISGVHTTVSLAPASNTLYILPINYLYVVQG